MIDNFLLRIILLEGVGNDVDIATAKITVSSFYFILLDKASLMFYINK